MQPDKQDATFETDAPVVSQQTSEASALPTLNLPVPKREPTVYYPRELENPENRLSCVLELYGYFHRDTNSYNITRTNLTGIKKENESPDERMRRVLGEMRDFGEGGYLGKIYQSEEETHSGPLFPPFLRGYYDTDGTLHFRVSDGGTDRPLVVCKKEPYSLKMDIFSRNTGILESDIMLAKGAVLIGCGSVGSLVALELARAGVGRFLLIDSDILGYHNICRHQCGIPDVGKYKTDALRERILQINPTAKIITQNRIIQDVSLQVLNDFCDKDTIVMGGADNREGDLYAQRIATEIGMPFMSIGLWHRAFAGEIFYSLPDGSPTYADFVAAIGGLSGRVNQNTRFYINEEELARASFEPGISVDIDFVSIIAVKLALDILNIGNPNHTPRLLSHLTQYTLVCNTNDPNIGGVAAEMFATPLQVVNNFVVPHANTTVQ